MLTVTWTPHKCISCPVSSLTLWPHMSSVSFPLRFFLSSPIKCCWLGDLLDGEIWLSWYLPVNWSVPVLGRKVLSMGRLVHSRDHICLLTLANWKGLLLVCSVSCGVIPWPDVGCLLINHLILLNMANFVAQRDYISRRLWAWQNSQSQETLQRRTRATSVVISFPTFWEDQRNTHWRKEEEGERYAIPLLM